MLAVVVPVARIGLFNCTVSGLGIQTGKVFFFMPLGAPLVHGVSYVQNADTCRNQFSGKSPAA